MTSQPPAPSPDDARRRAQLYAAKLKAIVADQLGVAGDGAELSEAQTLSLPDGAGLVLPGGRAHFLAARDGGLGAMLLLAERSGAESICVYGDESLGRLARQAELFDIPIEVFRLDGRQPVPAVPAAVAEEPGTPGELLSALEGAADAGVRTVAEHGEAIAEVAGLEIARASYERGELVVRVGVGWADQELSSMIEPGVAPLDRMLAAAEMVRQHRTPDATPHPLQRVAPERWLRSRLVEEPQKWGFAELVAVSLLEPRAGLRINAPAAAAGTRLDGSPILVVTSVGVNPELVVIAADLQRERFPGAELMLAVPKADNHAAIQRQADLLSVPVSKFLTPPVARDWPDGSWSTEP